MDPTETLCFLGIILIVAALPGFGFFYIGYSLGVRQRRVPSRRILFREAADPVGDLLAERIRFGQGR